MLLKATDPNSKESFLIQVSDGDRHLVDNLFNPVLYQVKSLALFPDEEEHLSN